MSKLSGMHKSNLPESYRLGTEDWEGNPSCWQHSIQHTEFDTVIAIGTSASNDSMKQKTSKQ